MYYVTYLILLADTPKRGRRGTKTRASGLALGILVVLMTAVEGGERHGVCMSEAYGSVEES